MKADLTHHRRAPALFKTVVSDSGDTASSRQRTTRVFMACTFQSADFYVNVKNIPNRPTGLRALVQ